VLKLLLFSVIFLTYLLPIAAAKVTRPRKSFSTLLALVVLGQVWYAFFLLFLYPRLL
jgi:hypothetical protein